MQISTVDIVVLAKENAGSNVVRVVRLEKKNYERIQFKRSSEIRVHWMVAS